jgi:hypothetical protein
MSISIPQNPTAIGMFKAHFGDAPSTQDAKAECEKWERLCGELLAERERLRAELEKAQLNEFCKGFELNQTMEQVYAQVDRETTLEQIVANLEREAEANA